MNPLRQLHDYGQSYWLDNLTRSMILNGELERRVREDGLRGITSNPAIFHKAISGQEGYDDQIRELTRSGLATAQIYERVVTDDIRAACDILRPVYDRSEEREGFVSLEVSPHLANETQASIEEARRLHAAVDRPNLMIKIPGTKAGLGAIEQLLLEDINVNITLLFSIKAYEGVAETYMRALERRAEAGHSLGHINSVASFFLSRIDTLVDSRLEAQIDPEVPIQTADPRPVDLLGRAAVANAKLAYRRFKSILETDRWQALAAKGANPQRMLWASTSTKNRSYNDIMYVEPLIGPFTVNTMPSATIAAFADHGRVEDTIERGTDEAAQVLEDLTKLGIDFEALTDQLLEEGIQKFVEPFDALMRLINEKSRALAS